jgi:hypothetical protein
VSRQKEKVIHDTADRMTFLRKTQRPHIITAPEVVGNLSINQTSLNIARILSV